MRSTRWLLLCGSLLVLIGLSLPVQARPDLVSSAQGGDSALLGQLQRAAGGTLRVGRHARTGLVRFTGVAPDSPIAVPGQLAATASPEQAARAFLLGYGKLYGASARAADLTLISTQAGDRDRDFVRFQQRYQGVPIMGAELIIQTGPRNTVAAVTGELLPEPDLDVRPRITAAAARQRAVASVARVGSATGLSAAAPELWIYDERILGGRGLYRPALVWRTEVTSADDPLLRELVLVDAQLGNVALAFSQVHAAIDRRICDAGNLRDSDTNPTNNCDGAPATEYVRSEGGPASAVADVNQAYDLSGDTYNFFFNRFGRDSLDGAGLPLRSMVRYCPQSPSITCPYVNAAWNGQIMYYGAGFASADDVVGHELAHGLTDYTSRLFYYYQSGAINESLSDVFGELVDLTNTSGIDTAATRWQLGEDLPASIGVIRDMENPPAFGDPDRMASPQYTADLDEFDGGGVHSNSGVNNKAAFLLTDGGTFNGQTVTGLGIDKVARLYYAVETSLLTSAADYQDLASGLQQACQNLIGTAGVSAADCVQVTNAINATEMTIEPPVATAPDAPVCAAGLSPTAFWSDDLENTASGRWTVQSLSGSSSWYYPPAVNPLDFDATYATSGSMNLWGYDQQTVSSSAMAMTASVALPTNAWMRFNHAHGFEDEPSSAYDGGILEYSINNGSSWVDAGSLITENGYNGTIATGFSNPLAARQAFVRESNGYYSSRLNLQSLAGQSVRFRFRLGTDNGGDDYGWFIDDVQLYTCAAALPSPTSTPSPTLTATSGPPVSPAPSAPPAATATPTGPGSPAPPNQRRTFVPQVAR